MFKNSEVEDKKLIWELGAILVKFQTYFTSILHMLNAAYQA